jgi:predicted nucleotidyltransferase
MDNPVEDISKDKIADFCRRWKARELAVFGSALRQDFGLQSDIDILITFKAEADWGLLDHMEMQQELEVLLGRNIDLISKRALERSENWLRRSAILKNTRVVFSEPETPHVPG